MLVLVISRAAQVRLALAMGFPTSKRTTQIPALRIAGVGEKKDPTVSTTSSAPAQLRLGSENRSQQHVIRVNQSHHRLTPIPIRVEPKMLPDQDCKKPNTWLWILKLVKAPLVLPKRLKAVEAGQGDFPSAHYCLSTLFKRHSSGAPGSVSVSRGGSISVSANV